MGTQRLNFQSTSTPIHLKPTKDWEAVIEIEVPAGEQAYCIYSSSLAPHPQRYIFHLRHPESQVSIKGLVIGEEESTPFLTTTVIHHAPRTKAETLVRTLAYQASQPHYEGLIQIEPRAENAESYLNHHSLLLGNEAKSWTLPSLEIKTDQVRCSHAATIRSLTELDLFYLRSRGLNQEEARQLCIEAFMADVAECQPKL